jgi:hypothetical protein
MEKKNKEEKGEIKRRGTKSSNEKEAMKGKFEDNF